MIIYKIQIMTTSLITSSMRRQLSSSSASYLHRQLLRGIWLSTQTCRSSSVLITSPGSSHHHQKQLLLKQKHDQYRALKDTENITVFSKIENAIQSQQKSLVVPSHHHHNHHHNNHNRTESHTTTRLGIFSPHFFRSTDYYCLCNNNNNNNNYNYYSSSILARSIDRNRSSSSNWQHRRTMATSTNTINTTYSVEERGARNSSDYRVYFKDTAGNPISPWHDIPLFADRDKRIYNMVVEIPRWTNAKMEIATGEPLNPIKQDVKKGALRFVRNPFPHKGYIWNYGAFPRTWEDPAHVDAATAAKGDNDPIDVLEIGQRVATRGEVVRVKILGTIALIDEGETDWKVLTISVDDPLAEQLNDVQDIEKFMPGLLRATIEWFKIYKIPDGKPANEFAFDGEAKNREFAEKVVDETAAFWRSLTDKKAGESGSLELRNTSLANSHSIKVDEAKAAIESKPASGAVPAIPIVDQSAIDKWYYIKL